MRTIKFRGQRIDNGEWVYGNLISVSKDIKSYKTELTTGIQVVEDGVFKAVYEVVSESVGQFTGLKDKNGKEFYEGDILDSSEKVPLLFEVYYEDGGFRYGTKDRSVDIGFSGHTWLKSILTRFHVIGNIHSNPELLT